MKRKKRRSQQEEVNPELATKFMNAKTFTEMRQILEQHPELLNDATCNLVDSLAIEMLKVDEAAYRYLKTRSDLLRSAKKIGISKAFAGKVDINTEGPDALGNLLGKFMSATTWSDARVVLEQHPVLLSETAGEGFRFLLDKFKEDGKNESTLIKHIDVIERCRKKGIDQTFSRQINIMGDEKLGLEGVIMKFLSTTKSQERKRILDLSPELFDEAVIDILERLKLELVRMFSVSDNDYFKRIELLQSIVSDKLKQK